MLVHGSLLFSPVFALSSLQLTLSGTRELFGLNMFRNKLKPKIRWGKKKKTVKGAAIVECVWSDLLVKLSDLICSYKFFISSRNERSAYTHTYY